MNAPAYVLHDGKRWYVVRSTRIDGAPAYVLRDPRGRSIVARVAECEAWQRPAETLRLFRSGEHVLEIRAAGSLVRAVTVRKARSSKRHETSIGAIYSLTLKGEAFRRQRPRKRGI